LFGPPSSKQVQTHFAVYEFADGVPAHLRFEWPKTIGAIPEINSWIYNSHTPPVMAIAKGVEQKIGKIYGTTIEIPYVVVFLDDAKEKLKLNQYNFVDSDMAYTAVGRLAMALPAQRHIGVWPKVTAVFSDGLEFFGRIVL